MGRQGEAGWKARALRAERLLQASVHLNVVNYQTDSGERNLAALASSLHNKVDYRPVLLAPMYDNHEAACTLRVATENKTRPANNAKKSSVPVDVYVARYELKRELMLNTIISQLLGLRSDHHITAHLAMLGILALRAGVQRKFWGVLSGIGVLPSFKWTEDFCRRLYSLPRKVKFKEQAVLGLATYDNCGYYRRKLYERTTAENDFLNTVNWYHIPLKSDQFPIDPTITTPWKPRRPHIGHLFSCNYRDHRELLTECMHFAHGLQDFLGYPDDPEHNALPCKYEVHEPLVNMDTASYLDNGVTLHRIVTELREALATLKFIIVAGDEQTFDRMVKLLIHGHAMFKWCIPWPGEMHLTAHTLHGTFRLWWDILLGNFSLLLGRTKVTKDWTMTNWNHQDMFMLVVCEAIRRWFCEVFCHDWMEQRAGMEARTSNNYSTHLLFQFMQQDGVPYVALRNLMRMSPSVERRNIIDKFYPYLTARFRSVNKHHYSSLCPHAYFIKKYLRDDIAAVIDAMYCQSCKGHPGRNTALDGLMEKINKLAKQLMHGQVTEERILTVIPWLNVTEPIARGWHDITPNYDDTRDAKLGAPDYEADIQLILEWLRMNLGSDWREASAVNMWDMFNDRSGHGRTRPWEHVERAYDDDLAYAQAKADELTWA